LTKGSQLIVNMLSDVILLYNHGCIHFEFDKCISCEVCVAIKKKQTPTGRKLLFSKKKQTKRMCLRFALCNGQK
jgi:hypothetical protein